MPTFFNIRIIKLNNVGIGQPDDDAKAAAAKKERKVAAAKELADIAISAALNTNQALDNIDAAKLAKEKRNNDVRV